MIVFTSIHKMLCRITLPILVMFFWGCSDSEGISKKEASSEEEVPVEGFAYIHSKGNDLHIYVYGEDSYYNPNEYLTRISSIVRNINKGMGLSAVEYLTLRKNGVEAEIALDEVRGNLQNRISRVYNAKLNEVISLEELVHRYLDKLTYYK